MDASELSRLTRSLTDVAMGRKPADRVIEHGRWVCVQSGEIISDTSIAILGERIAYIGPDASHCVGPGTQVLDAADSFLVPGLIDGHMHVESGMLTVTEFVRAVVPHGTTGMFIDPHEMANIFGLAGVKIMVDEAAVQPIHVWVQMPSCIPSAPGLETPGAMIGPKEVAEAMTWKGIIGLGEVMNFPGVFQGDEKMHHEMAETRHAGRVIGGHYASPDLGLPFHGYVAGGPEDDHEGTRLEDAVARVRQGMKVMMRYGSAWHDVASQVKAITEQGLDSRHFLLVTDDCHSGTLVHQGHMDRVLRHAIEQGLEPMTAIQMATINTATHFGVTRDVGMLAPGRYADIVLVDDLTEFRARQVIARGRTLAEDGDLRIERPEYTYPPEIRNSVHLAKMVTEDDFRIHASGSGRVAVNVIGVVENQAPTGHLKMDVDVQDGELKLSPAQDLAKVALVERHNGSGRIQLGLVSGFGLEAGCALGSTVAHDSHHMLIVGTDDTAMATAANTLAEQGGGQIVTRGSDVLATIELPIAGLMSDEPAEVVADKAARLLEAYKACGCRLNNANMQLSLLALVVIPALRISDLGLVDVEQFKFIPVLDAGE